MDRAGRREGDDMSNRPMRKFKFTPIVGACAVCGKEINTRKSGNSGTVWVIGELLACSQAHADQLSLKKRSEATT